MSDKLHDKENAALTQQSSFLA